MLSLRKITLTHFKNYDIKSYDFKEKIIGICGLNGVGKTNLLDAIYYTCFTKSYFNSSDQLNIGFGKDGFRIEADIDNNEKEEKVVCVFRGAAKKEIMMDNIVYEKLSHHIGKLPAVIIAPDDIEILIGGSELRRKQLDAIICQLDAAYLQQLMTYNKVLLQRNSLLKQFADKNFFDAHLLQVINDQLIPPGNFVFKKRKEFCTELIPLVQHFYKKITDTREQVVMNYDSKLFNSAFDVLLANNIEKDRYLQRTNAGVHKDDLIFELNGETFKTTASQGQRKSLLFALKLAEYEILKQKKGFAPLLLLDDVFEKLDENRMKNLLQWVCNENTGQVFITDTHYSRLQHMFNSLNSKAQIIEL